MLLKIKSMKLNHALTPAILGVTIALVQPQTAMALSSTEVGKIAKSITVLIDNKSSSGTGVIIKKEGNVYTVLTAKHVIETQAKYDIVTPDGQRYALNYSTVTKMSGVDLATVQFTSNQNYPVAKVGNSDEAIEGTTAYVAGFPQANAVISDSIYNFIAGQITANASKPLNDGYALVYSNNTLPGMSGGPVLNEKGELVGIHGRGDTTENFQVSERNPNVVIKTGFNLGVPINTFLKLSVGTRVNPPQVNFPVNPTNTTPRADDFYIQGGDKYKKGDFKGAIADYTQAIKLNPNYVNAYNDRGIARSRIGDAKGEIDDYNQAIRINPNYANAYYNRGIARSEMGDKQGAIADYTQAIKIDPKYVNAYYNRGNTRSNLGDKLGAIADYNEAVKIDPKYVNAYYNRGNAHSALGKKQEAINDYTLAVNVDPKYVNAYYNRGIIYSQLGNLQASIADYTQAVNIDPKYVNAYYNRAIDRSASGDKQGAIADYTQAIKIDPKYVNAYYNRGNIYSDLGNKQEAIADYNQAIRIDPKYINAYYNRANARSALKEYREAINDYNQALKLDPKYINAYNNRGLARSNLGDKKGAIADFNQALKIDANYANAYYNRGLDRSALGDKQGAIGDLQKAADLYQKQGEVEFSQKVLQYIRKLQQS
jgi:tetratricopeptide (TPR) repeat protein/V8-like Glu-specific endopeptidase